MSPKYRFIPIGGGGGVTPTGTLEIRSEGTFDVTNYAEVDVDIFDDTTTKNITNNGTYNAEDDHVLGYSQVTVTVPASAVDSGTKQITTNGNNQDVVGYAAVDVNVPASAVDSGTKQDTISTNGTSTINVVGYANHEVTVSVPASAVDSGTKQITTNGNNQDVIGYAAVDVNVPAPYWEGTQAQYDALAPDYDPNTLYLITA